MTLNFVSVEIYILSRSLYIEILKNRVLPKWLFLTYFREYEHLMVHYILCRIALYACIELNFYIYLFTLCISQPNIEKYVENYNVRFLFIPSIYKVVEKHRIKLL